MIENWNSFRLGSYAGQQIVHGKTTVEDPREVERNVKRRKALAESVGKALELLQTGQGKQCPCCGNIRHLDDFNKRKRKGVTPCLSCWTPPQT